MRSTPFVLALMAACAGVVDLWALTSFGAFAGVITGNLVTAGGAAGSLRLGELLAPLVAVAGFGARGRGVVGVPAAFRARRADR